MLVEYMSGIFRISQKNFKKYLKGEILTLEECDAKFIGYIDYDVTDMDEEERKSTLDYLNTKEK